MQTLNNLLKRENNNFDLIRLMAALAVIFSHSFRLFNANGFNDPSAYKHDDAGSLAVYVFFFLSGFLITNSIARSESKLSFVIMRVARIYPALIICVFITVIIGAFLTTNTISNYFSNRLTWAYFFYNATLLHQIIYNLPGVFENNHYPNAVNGSLWTLPLEITCYILIFFIGSAILSKNNILRLILITIFIAAAYYLKLDFFNAQVLFFSIGSLCYLFRKRIVIDWRIGLFTLILFFAFNTHLPYLLHICLIYNLLVLSGINWVRIIKLPGDFSYGVYIYSFLIQQALASNFPGLNPYNGMLLTIPLVLIWAGLSWFIIELPALKLGRALTHKYRR